MEHPKIYLGDQFGNMIVYGAEFWYVSAEKYVKAAVENVEQNIEKSNQRLPNSCKKPHHIWLSDRNLHFAQS